jgi:hypothetical protein
MHEELLSMGAFGLHSSHTHTFCRSDPLRRLKIMQWGIISITNFADAIIENLLKLAGTKRGRA